VARATDKTRIMLYSKFGYKRTINLKMRCNKKQKSGEMVKKKKQDCCKQESDAASSSDGHIKNENKLGLSLNMRQM
jgi:protein required for attachment to host cells